MQQQQTTPSGQQQQQLGGTQLVEAACSESMGGGEETAATTTTAGKATATAGSASALSKKKKQASSMEVDPASTKIQVCGTPNQTKNACINVCLTPQSQHVPFPLARGLGVTRSMGNVRSTGGPKGSQTDHLCDSLPSSILGSIQGNNEAIPFYPISCDKPEESSGNYLSTAKIMNVTRTVGMHAGGACVHQT